MQSTVDSDLSDAKGPPPLGVVRPAADRNKHLGLGLGTAPAVAALEPEPDLTQIIIAMCQVITLIRVTSIKINLTYPTSLLRV